MKDVFEGSAATVSLSLTRGRSDAARTARLVFTTTGTVKIDPVDLALPAKPFVGKAPPVKHRVEFPDVPATEPSYEVQYHIEWEGKKISGPDRWRVWPDTVQLTTKKKVNGSLTAQGNLPVQLVQNGSGRDSMVPDSGTTLLLIPAPGPFEIALPSPRRFVQWLEGKDKGRERVLEWDIVPHKARITLPAGEEKTRQYVNLGFGNEVKFEVATVTHDGDPSPQQEVFVQVEFKNPTKRGSKPPPLPDADYLKERTVTRLTDIQKSNGDKTWKGKLKTGGDGKADFAVYLGKGGGETCEVKIGGTDTVEDDKRTLETWRKLFVGYTHSNTDLTKNLWSADKRQHTTDCYKDAFIEIEYTPDAVAPNPLPKFEDRGGWVDGAEVGKSPGQILVINVADGQNGSWVQLAELTRPPTVPKDLFVNIMVADLMIEHQPVIGKYLVNKSSGVGQYKGAEKAHYVVRGNAFNGKDPDTHFGKLPKKPFYASEASYQLCQMVKKDVDPSGLVRIGAEVALASDDIKIEHSGKKDPNAGTCTLLFPDTVKTHLKAAPTNVIEVKFSLLLVNDKPAAGISNGEHAVLLDQGATAVKEINNTACHEIGHAIGMCGDVSKLRPSGNFIDRIPDYDVAQHPTAKTGYLPAHGRWYTKRNHTGDHCAEGESESSYAKWKDFGMLATGYKCVIYGSGQWSTTPTKYCERCMNLLKAMEVYVGKQAST